MAGGLRPPVLASRGPRQGRLRARRRRHPSDTSGALGREPSTATQDPVRRAAVQEARAALPQQNPPFGAMGLLRQRTLAGGCRRSIARRLEAAGGSLGIDLAGLDRGVLLATAAIPGALYRPF